MAQPCRKTETLGVGIGFAPLLSLLIRSLCFQVLLIVDSVCSRWLFPSTKHSLGMVKEHEQELS